MHARPSLGVDMHDPLTREQAIALYDTGFWENLAYVERARFQLSEERLCMPFEVFLEAVERALGRPVKVGELLASHRLLAELGGDHHPLELDELLSMLPEDKRILLAA